MCLHRSGLGGAPTIWIWPVAQGGFDIPALMGSGFQPFVEWPLTTRMHIFFHAQMSFGQAWQKHCLVSLIFSRLFGIGTAGIIGYLSP